MVEPAPAGVFEGQRKGGWPNKRVLLLFFQLRDEYK